MPPGKRKPAHSSAAKAMVELKGVPENLSSFLGKTDFDIEQANQDQESAIAMNFRYLNKRSDITKQKSMTELISRIGTIAEPSVSKFLPNAVDAALRHNQHSNPAIRAGVYLLLKAFMDRGRAVKLELGRELPALSGAWVLAMNDMEKVVRDAATDAFEATFSEAKRDVMLLTYKTNIMSYLANAIEEIVEIDGKPLQDDAVDPRSNVLYAAFRGLGFMATKVSASQQEVMAFLTEKSSFSKVFPACRGKPSKCITGKTPLVRSAALSLLRDVVSVCPLTIKLHQLVSQALDASIVDTDAILGARAWELLLFWCRGGLADAITFLPPGFLDRIVDALIACDGGPLGDVIFPSLLPLLTQLSKDGRCAGVLDEFCGALTEKLRLLGETPNISARELSLVLSALLECWELHCVRRRGTDRAAESEELFSDIVLKVVDMLKQPSKEQRYFPHVVEILARSLIKTSLRCEQVFSHCFSALCERPEAPFCIVPDISDIGFVSLFYRLQAATVGALYKMAVTEGNTYASKVPSYTLFLEKVIECNVARGDVNNLVVLLQYSGGCYLPSKSTSDLIVNFVVLSLSQAVSPGGDILKDAESIPEISRAVPSKADGCQTLLAIALSWKVPEQVERLTEVAQATNLTGVKDTLQDHLMRDPQTVFDVLVDLCAANEFNGVERCVLNIEEQGIVLSTDQKELGLSAISRALEHTLALVANCEAADGEDEINSGRKRSTASTSAGGHESCDDTSTSGSYESSTEEDEDPDESQDSETRNEALTVHDRVIEWCSMLARDSSLSRVLGLDTSVFVNGFLDLFCSILSAVAPRLYPEHYVSMRALRIALQAGDDEMTTALGQKHHFLKLSDFQSLEDRVRQLFSSHEVPADAIDDWGRRMVEKVQMGRLYACYCTSHQLQYALPLVSMDFLQSVAVSPELWGRYVVRRSVVSDAKERKSFTSLFDGYLTLAGMDVTLITCVRSAQLVRLLDYCSATVSSTPMIYFLLLQSAARREIFTDATNTLILDKLLPQALRCFETVESADELSSLLMDDPSQTYLIGTLGAVLNDMAAHHVGDLSFLLCARRVVSSLTRKAVEALYTPAGAKAVTDDIASFLTTLFAHLDEAANTLRENILSQLPPSVEQMFLGACCELPRCDVVTVKLSLIVHRHLSTMPIVSDSMTTSLIKYAKDQGSVNCLEVLSELSCTRILNLDTFSLVVQAAVNSMCQCYALRHMPSNGRLPVERAGGHHAAAPFEHLRRVVTAAVLVRRGVVIHSRRDDVLRSSVNLVVFDTVCEAVSRLRQTNDSGAPLLAQLIAFVSDFMSELLTDDVAVVRASEASALKVASAMCYAYLWVSSTSVAKLEAIGMGTIAGLLRCTGLLANLTLVRSSISLQEVMRPILDKLSLKPLRLEFSAANPAKLNTFRRHNTVISKTHKQKLLLFPYLLAWCVTLTSPVAPVYEDRPVRRKEWRQSVYQLLDLLFSLLLSPVLGHAKRVEDTFIGSSLHLSESGRAPEEMLGFEVVALTRTQSREPMAQLARGAAAVFTFLLQGDTLPMVRSWCDTTERKAQALLSEFVRHHISPMLIQENLLGVLSHSPDGKSTFSISESTTATVSMSQRTVELVYAMEDVKESVRLSFPSAFPLASPVAEYSTGKECCVSTEKWRSWMLKMTVMLFAGTADIWECVELFDRNLAAHFEGQEPCPICFALVSSGNRKLPTMRCAVCNNYAFHSQCLYTWWANSGQNICPLCRSAWIAE